MKRLFTMSLAISMAAYPILSIRAATADVSDASEVIAVPAALSAEQIDNLLAPVALYPDPLVAQLLPASTFVEQIDQAARYLRAHNNQPTGVDSQSWDVSVKSLSHYYQVVYSMADKLDWTTALGQAYVSQASDVFKSIQRLRKKAKDAGYLKTNPQQNVVTEGDVIKIVPAQAQVIYVPTYDPQVVYAPPPSSGPSTGAAIAGAAISFGVGLAIGAWLNNDCNWNSNSVYYHGWRGSGWVGNSATVVKVNGNYYVNNRYNNVNINTTVVNRNVNYNNINTYNNVSRNVNYNNVNVNNVNRNNANVNNVNRNDVNTNAANRTAPANQNLNRNVGSSATTADSARARGGASNARATPEPAAQSRGSAFGGGGASASQTRTESKRGETSRASRPEASSSRGDSTSRSAPSSSGGGGRKRN